MRGLLCSPPFVWFICGRMWCPGVLPAALPAPFSATLSPALWVYLCKCGAAGSASARTACAICPTLRQSQSRHSHASPLHPSCRSLPLLPVWMNVYFLFPWCWSPLLFDSLSVLVVRGGAVCLPTPPSWFSGFPLGLYSPQQLQASSPWCQAAISALIGEGADDLTLLPISCGRCRVGGHSSLGPCTDTRDLTVPAQSPHCLFFQCPLQLASKLHISWDSVGCSLHSSEDQLGVPAGHRENWDQLPSTLPPSF